MLIPWYFDAMIFAWYSQCIKAIVLSYLIKYALICILFKNINVNIVLKPGSKFLFDFVDISEFFHRGDFGSFFITP